MIIFAATQSSIPLLIVGAYLVILLGLGIYSSTLFQGTSKDYFVASRSIGPFMLLMSVFGTTMTGFALVGSTGKSLPPAWQPLVHWPYGVALFILQYSLLWVFVFGRLGNVMVT